MIFYTLAITSSNHDSSVCLLRDSDVLAMWACERTSRNKHTNKISRYDIEKIKEYTNFVDLVVLVNVFDENVKLPAERNEDDADKMAPPVNPHYAHSITDLKHLFKSVGINWGKIIADNKHHHLYHAAAGFYTSGFDDALCVVMDGVGSSFMWKDGIIGENTSIFYANNDGITCLYQQFFYKPRTRIGWSDRRLTKVKQMFTHPVDLCPQLDIGKMYGTIARQIGFQGSHEAGKVMGLAGYGQPNNLPPMFIGDTIISDMNLFRMDGQINTFLHPELSTLSEQDKANLAYNVQKAAEKVFVRRVGQALALKPSNNIVVGGGCALNILANSEIKRKYPNLNVHPDPIAADPTQSLGAALFHYKRLHPKTKHKKLDTLYFGPQYDIMKIKSRLTHLVEQHNNESNVQIVSN